MRDVNENRLALQNVSSAGASDRTFCKFVNLIRMMNKTEYFFQSFDEGEDTFDKSIFSFLAFYFILYYLSCAAIDGQFDNHSN